MSLIIIYINIIESYYDALDIDIVVELDGICRFIIMVLNGFISRLIYSRYLYK